MVVPRLVILVLAVWRLAPIPRLVIILRLRLDIGANLEAKT